MIVAGVMSGTSADGINVALVRITGGLRQPKLKLLGHAEYPYAVEVRRTVLAVHECLQRLRREPCAPEFFTRGTLCRRRR